MENKRSNDKWYKTDDNKIINKKHIRWVLKMNDCLEICTKSIGCSTNIDNGDTHRICKMNNPSSYNEINKYFS